MDPLVQASDPIFETFLVLLPRHTVHPGGRLVLQRHEACLEELRSDVVQ
jgi:hypothetical protein